MSFHIDRKEFDEWVEEKAWDRLWEAYQYATSGSESVTCYCSIIDGRKFLCSVCSKQLKDELEALKDDHTDLKEANKKLQDDLAEANSLYEKALGELQRLERAF